METEDREERRRRNENGIVPRKVKLTNDRLEEEKEKSLHAIGSTKKVTKKGSRAGGLIVISREERTKLLFNIRHLQHRPEARSISSHINMHIEPIVFSQLDHSLEVVGVSWRGMW